MIDILEDIEAFVREFFTRYECDVERGQWNTDWVVPNGGPVLRDYEFVIRHRGIRFRQTDEQYADPAHMKTSVSVTSLEISLDYQAGTLNKLIEARCEWALGEMLTAYRVGMQESKECVAA